MHTHVLHTPTEPLGNGPGLTELERAMERCAAELLTAATREHLLLEKPRVSGTLRDEAAGRGLLVIREHIDTDRYTPGTGGTQGDQFRFTLWLVTRDGARQELYTDHAWIRPELKHPATLGGRDAGIRIHHVGPTGLTLIATGRNGAPFDRPTTVGPRFVTLTFDGATAANEEFALAARNLVEQVAPRLGYDRLSGFMEIPGESIAAAVFTAENGYDHGHDTVYLVHRTPDGVLHHRTLHRSSHYTTLEAIERVREGVRVTFRAHGERVVVVGIEG